VLLVMAFSSCEKIYLPNVDKREGVIVADARIVVGNDDNYIRLYKSIGYNETYRGYPAVTNAMVYIVDNNGSEVQIHETEDGIYPVHLQLNTELSYKLKISHDGNNYESEFEPVPKVPEIDSVYGFQEVRVSVEGGESSVDDFRYTLGLQAYCDINTETESPYYRFTARKVLQYYFVEEFEFEETINHYIWDSYYPTDIFNIAAPPEYTDEKSIEKHSLFFLNRSVYMEEDNYFAGWILILYQHGLSQSSYNYYKDLNNQLDSEGRLFDPMYVQPRNNLKCTNKPEQLILGNFEISTIKEYRYFIKYISDEKGYWVKPIPYFYEISKNDTILNNLPDFWEWGSKTYPND
jgi:hypothetical protein